MIEADRRLRVAVFGGTQAPTRRDRLRRRVRAVEADDFDPAWIEIEAFVGDEPGPELTGHCHLAVGQESSPWIDVVVPEDDEDVGNLALDRLVPWVRRWRVNRRAPRAQVAQLFDPDPAWADVALRLVARLRSATATEPVLRIDHIGSTSIPGIKAKDLIDIQITVPTISDAGRVAEAATAAGFVHVDGPLFGKDRHGDVHPEEVCVDADPGRPVNISVRPATAPVARDALLFRDWLRADEAARRRYEAFKLERVGHHIDEYGDAKEPFISACLREAGQWAADTGWSGFDDDSRPSI